MQINRPLGERRNKIAAKINQSHLKGNPCFRAKTAGFSLALLLLVNPSNFIGAWNELPYKDA